VKGCRAGQRARLRHPPDRPRGHAAGAVRGGSAFKVGYGWTVECLKRGVYFHPYHNMFMSAAITEADVEATLAATDEAFAALKRNFDTLEVHPILATRLGH
jgi:hypothetical protein